MSRRDRYRKGFAAGVLSALGTGAASFAVFELVVARRRKGRIVRLEKALQIGRPVEEVFSAWLNLSALSEASHLVRSLGRDDDRWHWRVVLGGREIEWDAKVEQFIPNQAIGWKSLNGPKHTGRITFAPLGNDTLVQVTMNYAPRSLWLRGITAPVSQHLERYLDQVLRDFKAALEGKGQETVVRRSPKEEPARMHLISSSTGTHGSLNTARIQNTRFGGPPNPIDPLRPPEAKS